MINIPTQNVKEFVQMLAADKNVVYVETPLDKLAHIWTNLSGDDIEPDAINDLILELKRKNIISSQEMITLIANYLKEKKSINI